MLQQPLGFVHVTTSLFPAFLVVLRHTGLQQVLIAHIAHTNVHASAMSWLCRMSCNLLMVLRPH